MTTKKMATKNGARRVTANLDNLADLFQNHHKSLGIPTKVAMDFAYRCDLLSDSISKKAGFDPSVIGEEVPGPAVSDPNNPFMAGEFTQERFHALSDKQEGGELAGNAAGHVADPKLASVVEAAKAFLKAAGELPPALQKINDEKAEKAEKKDEKKEAAKKADEDETEEDESVEAAKKASELFGLFSDK